MKSLIAVLVLLQAPPLFNYDSGGLVIRGHDKLKSSAFQDIATGVTTFHAVGKPVIIEVGSYGATLTGNIIDGKASKVQKEYQLDSFKASGGANFIADSGLAAKYRQKVGLKPLLENGSEHIELHSAKFDYAKSVFTIPSNFSLSESGGGQGEDKEGKFVYQQTSSFDGVSGTITLSIPPKGKGKADIIKAIIQGPATAVYKRTTYRNTEGVVDTVELKADKFVLDRTKPEGTLRCIGNVHVVTTGTNPSEWSAADFVLTLSPDGKPTGFNATSKDAPEPAKSGDDK